MIRIDHGESNQNSFYNRIELFATHHDSDFMGDGLKGIIQNTQAIYYYSVSIHFLTWRKDIYILNL